VAVDGAGVGNRNGRLDYDTGTVPYNTALVRSDFTNSTTPITGSKTLGLLIINHHSGFVRPTLTSCFFLLLFFPPPAACLLVLPGCLPSNYKKQLAMRGYLRIALYSTVPYCAVLLL